MFVTALIGAGGAQMLSPVTNRLHPFGSGVAQRDRRTLESVIPVSVYQDITEPDWMKKLRAASDVDMSPPRLQTCCRGSRRPHRSRSGGECIPPLPVAEVV